MPEIAEDISLEEYRAMKAAGNQPQTEPEESTTEVVEEKEEGVTPEESPDSEPEIPEEEPELYNGKPPTESQKRFKQLFGEYTPKDLAAKRKAIEEEVAALRSRLQVAEQSPRQHVEKPAEPPKKETFRSRPKLDDFKTVEEWQAADTVWLDDRDEWRENQRRQTEAQKTQQTQAQARQTEAQRQIAEGRTRFRDFDIVLTAPISDTIVHELLDDPKGYEIAYMLAKNPSEAQRISALSPSKQLIELGEFRAMNKKPQAKKNSQPLKPTSKLSSGGGAQLDATEKRIREIQAKYRRK
jgi:hypothetical protein